MTLRQINFLIEVCVCVCTCVRSVYRDGGGTMTNSITLSTPCTQIVVSHTVSPQIGLRVLWRDGWSSLGSGTIQVDPAVSYCAKSKGRIKDNGFLLKSRPPPCRHEQCAPFHTIISPWSTCCSWSHTENRRNLKSQVPFLIRPR